MPNILGDKLKDAREKAGLSVEALAMKASLSFKQLEEIEIGGNSFFYTAEIKLIVAKKIGKMLGLNEDEFLES